MLSVLLLTLMIFMHWAIYNFYYVYATRRIRTRRLSQSNETVQMLLNQYDSEGSDWLYQSDAAAQVQNPSPRFCKACGLLPEVLAGLPLTSLFRPGAQLDDLRTRLAKGIPFRGIVVPIEVADKERWFSLNGQPSRGSDGNVTGWRGFVADVTATREAEEQVKYLAHFDQLTRLPNRTQVRQCLERALSDANRGQIVGLLYIDLDHFKMVNDGHGHAMGDEVLREMARRLEAAVRPLDVVGRLGGDEFVVLLPHLHSPEQGMQIARRVQEKVGETMEIDGLVLPVGATMGLAMAPFDAQTAEDLLRAADVAMYDAKTRGRGSISIFDPAMQEELRVRRELETDLRLALEGGQLELHYQPIHGTIADRTVGYEALLRWEHPTRGMIQPDTFISIAEESGLIVEIGSWVLRTALAEAATWPEDMFVAVNLSPAQMRDSAIVGLVINALAASGVVPQRLELEITETMLIRDTERVLAILHQFRSLGVRIALDDFGTGYSSLNYLRSFPFDKIKIDRCFISELPFRSDCQAIIRSVRLLASELHMTTTAEGVETAEQLAILRENGIDLVQGYLISRPIPAAALPYATASPNRVAKGAVQPAIGERNSGTLARLSKPAAEGAANRPARRKGAARGS
jgi:diguanylate cyclase (GGDEF)-like protein/PAS domain S-box-containing protein